MGIGLEVMGTGRDGFESDGDGQGLGSIFVPMQFSSLHFTALPLQLRQSHIYNSWQCPHHSSFLDSNASLL